MSKEFNPCEDCNRNCEVPCWKVEHGLLAEVVRCGECRYRMRWNGVDLCFNPGSQFGAYKTAVRIKKNGFCSEGKRRECAK